MMGCYFSSPILDDTSILAHLEVRRYASLKGVTTFKNDAPGLLYTDGTNLHYEPTCGRNKRACCLCCRQSFLLSSINSVSITREDEMVLHYVFPPPAIKITGGDFVICISSTSISDMEGFVRYLEKLQLPSQQIVDHS